MAKKKSKNKKSRKPRKKLRKPKRKKRVKKLTKKSAKRRRKKKSKKKPEKRIKKRAGKKRRKRKKKQLKKKAKKLGRKKRKKRAEKKAKKRAKKMKRKIKKRRKKRKRKRKTIIHREKKTLKKPEPKPKTKPKRKRRRRPKPKPVPKPRPEPKPRPKPKSKKKPEIKTLEKIVEVFKKAQEEESAEIIKEQIENPDEQVHKTKIRLIGIGGGAASIVSEIAPDIIRADFVVADTDTKSLNQLSQKVKKFQFGEKVTKGVGTGMNDLNGEISALNDKERIKDLMKGQDLCIIVACLGGGTSSGAAPVFAKISKNLGNLTYGIFTLPFEFEGEKKMEMALKSLEKIKPCLNAYSVMPNERIFQVIDKNTPLKSALSAINKRLADNLEGLVEIIFHPGLINIDFADLKAILSGRGKLSYLNSSEIQTSNKEDSINDAISSPLYPYALKGAKGIIYNIKGGSELKLAEVSHMSKIILESINKQAKIIFGINQNKSFQDKIKITILAVGCVGKFFSKAPVPAPAVTTIKKAVKKIARIKKNMPGKKIIPDKIISGKKLQKIKKIKKHPEKPVAEKPAPGKIKKIKKISPKAAAKPEEENKKEINPETVEVKVRRTGLELKKAAEEAEKEILEQEKTWETPAILRRNNLNS